MLFLHVLFFVLSCAALIISGEVVVKTLSRIAGFLRLSEYVVAFILMAAATSIPELFVGITSSLAGKGALALGNVIGANLLNLTLVIGIPVIISNGMRISSKETKKDSFYMFIIAALPPVLMLLGNQLSRLDGVILIIAFLLYTRHTIMARKGFHRDVRERVSKWGVVLNTSLFIIMLPVLFLSAHFAVKTATSIARDFSLPPIFIGLFIISIGTTLPELVVGLRAVRTKHHEIVLGDIIGSVVTNSTLVIGVAALIHPLTANFFLFLTSTAFMLLAAFLFSTFTESGGRFDQKEGVALIMLYVLFLLVELNLKGFF